MKYYLNCKKIDTAINRAKNQLIKEGKKKGIYENFGQEQIREIEEKFIDISNYSKEENKKRNILSSFSRWCYSYCG